MDLYRRIPGFIPGFIFPGFIWIYTWKYWKFLDLFPGFIFALIILFFILFIDV